VHDGPRLQVLRLEPIGNGNGFWLGRAWLYGLLLGALLGLHLGLHLGLLLSHGLLSQSLDVFLDRYSVPLGLGGKLHLDLLDLLGRGLFTIGAEGYGNGNGAWGWGAFVGLMLWRGFLFGHGEVVEAREEPGRGRRLATKGVGGASVRRLTRWCLVMPHYSKPQAGGR
jgi:hypothetical protein